MSLHDEFETARKTSPQVPWEMGPLSGKLAVLASKAPELARDAILRAQAGDHFADDGIGFTLEMKGVGKDSFKPEELEKLPGYRRLVEALADPAIDLGFSIGATRTYKTGTLVMNVTVKIEPGRTFKGSVIHFRGDSYDEYSHIDVYKDGPPAWAVTKPKLRGLSVTQ